MVKFILDNPGAPLDYPTLGFIAEADGAILDGTLFTPDLEIPPDAYWSVYGGGSAETDIDRYATPSEEYLDPTPEVTAGYLLAYDTDANTYVPTSPDDVIGTDAWSTTLSAAIGGLAVRRESGTLGAELVSNGGFATNLTGWAGTGWAQSSGKAQHTAPNTADLIQAGLPAVVGNTYLVSYIISGRSAGSVTLYFGGVHIPGAANGTYTGYVTATSTDALRITVDDAGAFNGQIDDVSVKLLTASTARVDDRLEFTKGIKLDGPIDVQDGTPIRIGKDALRNTGTGEYNIPNSNIGIGYQAGKNATDGHVTAVGYRAAESTTDGVATAFGKWAGLANTTGHSSFFGNAAGRSNTTGDIDAFGDECAAENTTGTIAAFGYYAGHSNETGTVTAVGHQAGMDCGPAGVFTAVGYQAGANCEAEGSTFVGHLAGAAATTGKVTAVGHEALAADTTGVATAVGYKAGTTNGAGTLTAVGHEAGYAHTSGISTLVGHGAGYGVTSGSVTAIGHNAGGGDYGPVTDEYVVLIGQGANRDSGVVGYMSNYIAIGLNALATKSNQVVLGNSSIAETKFYGSQVLTEQGADPDAPAANGGALYLKDNGSGKTQLCIRFNTGAVQVIATQP